MTPKVVRDSVHGDIQIDQKALAVINDPLFQRLKRISQNGFLYLVYPGMKHTRFEHSLGAYHLARKWVEELSANKSVEAKLKKHSKNFPNGSITNGSKILFDETFETISSLNDEWGDVVRLAALMHDIGHGPLSHTLEKCDLLELKNIDDWATVSEIHKFLKNKTDIEHEDFTLLYLNRILIDKTTVLNLTGSKLDQFISRVGSLLHKDYRKEHLKKYNADDKHISLFANLISSLFDVDRMDYLRRDSQKAGVEYGNVDIHRIIKTVSPVLYQTPDGKIKSGFLTDARNVHVLDHFLISLFEMYTILYFHPRNISTDHEFKKLVSLLKTNQLIEMIDINRHAKLDEWSFLENVNSESKGFLKRMLDRQTPKAEIFQMFSKITFEPDEHLHFISQKSKRPFFKGDEQVFLVEASYPLKELKVYPWNEISLVAKNLNSETYSPQIWWKNESFEEALNILEAELSKQVKAQGSTGTDD